jgi:hypothetical protein
LSAALAALELAAALELVVVGSSVPVAEVAERVRVAVVTVPMLCQRGGEGRSECFLLTNTGTVGSVDGKNGGGGGHDAAGTEGDVAGALSSGKAGEGGDEDGLETHCDGVWGLFVCFGCGL